MFCIPKIGDKVMVIKTKEIKLPIGAIATIEDIVTYENPVLTGEFKVKLSGVWYESDYIRKLNIIEQLKFLLNPVFHRSMNALHNRE